MAGRKKAGLKEKLASLPELPGVYLFKDATGKTIYIGKAKSLKKRVHSHFFRQLSAKSQAMASRVADIELILTPTPAQAQILEAALIKEKMPQYNVSLRDDKSFPFIRISSEEFPIISISRKKKSGSPEAADYYGPYTEAKLLRQAFKTMRRIFGFRTCRKLPAKPCLYFRLKLCPAPCAGKISAGEYAQLIQRIRLFLESRNRELSDQLSHRMKEESIRHNFEEAGRIRDQIKALGFIARQGRDAPGINEAEDLQKLLKLPSLPERVEAFDISNISGKQACGSMVSFYRGIPDKNNYRRFRIKGVSGIDDYAMISEIVSRRYSRLLREGKTFPDLALIDGGAGHLSAARRAIEGLGITLPLASIAKEEENIYTPEARRPLRFTGERPALNLIRRLRDEAHRFALAYHHLLRRKNMAGERNLKNKHNNSA